MAFPFPCDLHCVNAARIHARGVLVSPPAGTVKGTSPMNSGLIGKIDKAKRYATERHRMHVA